MSYVTFGVVVARWLLTPPLEISRPMSIAGLVTWLVTAVAAFILVG